MIKPHGAKLLVEVEEKKDQGVTTSAGIYLEKKDKDSSDRAMLYGKIIDVGSKEIDQWGNGRIASVFSVGEYITFNRYNAFKVIAKGIKDIWVVHVNDVWCRGELEDNK